MFVIEIARRLAAASAVSSGVAASHRFSSRLKLTQNRKCAKPPELRAAILTEERARPLLHFFARRDAPGILFLPKGINFPKILRTMRTDVDHLPAAKQRELERIVEILFDEFGQATEHATGRRKGARILKIILFGSHARGDWVDAPLSANQYKSDYDILVIVSQKELTDRAAYWAKAEERLIRAYTIEKTLRTPVNFIVHSLHEVNDGLAHGRVFFMEVAKDGIAIYEADDRELATPKPKTPEQALEAAREYFEEWMPSAAGFLDTSKYATSRGRLKEAAFQLHQATERLYGCLLLTLTFYTPYNHNIAFLRSLAEGLDRRLHGVWPEANRSERAMFQKLKEAYTKARYSKHYRISEDELTWLGERVEELGRIVHQVCRDKIAELEKSIG